MKKLIVLFASLIICFSGSSQVDSLTYGITSLTQGTGLYLSKINASDGSVSYISANAISLPPGAFGRTIDPRLGVFYYITGSFLLAFNLKTGELLQQVTIINFPNSVFQGIQYNYLDLALYGLVVDAAGSEIRLAKLDPNTGLLTAISGNPLSASCSILSGNALDPVHGVYYFETISNTDSHLLGVDIHSGDLVSDVHFDNDDGCRFGPIAYNCHDSSLYGLTGNYREGRKLGRIDPYTGDITVLSNYNVADTILNEQATIDPFAGLFYFEATDHTYRGVDLGSGDLLSMPAITAPSGSYFTGFMFNNSCYYNSPVSVRENQASAQLTIFPNPVSGLLTIRSSLPMLNASILDFTGRKVFLMDCHGLKELQADLSAYNEGIYILRISTEKECLLREFVKVAPGPEPGK